MSTLNGQKSAIVETVQEELDADPDTSDRLTRTAWKDPVPEQERIRRKLRNNDGVDPTFGRMAHDWNHTNNVSDENLGVVDEALRSVTAGDWGAYVVATA